MVEADKTIATYGINAVCTHLGCVVPFNSAENKFICPCHGSQYNFQGKVVRGPAPLVRSISNPRFFTVNTYIIPLINHLFNRSHWPWLTPTSTTARSYSCRGSKLISVPAKNHGGHRYIYIYIYTHTWVHI